MRLDHLLSKEHPTVVSAVGVDARDVGVTGGIIDTLRCGGLARCWVSEASGLWRLARPGRPVGGLVWRVWVCCLSCG